MVHRLALVRPPSPRDPGLTPMPVTTPESLARVLRGTLAQASAPWRVGPVRRAFARPSSEDDDAAFAFRSPDGRPFRIVVEFTPFQDPTNSDQPSVDHETTEHEMHVRLDRPNPGSCHDCAMAPHQT